jgi:hypothetical protein
MVDFNTFKKTLDEKIEKDFEDYMTSEFFEKKYGHIFVPKIKDMLKDTYLVGAKRGLVFFGEFAKNYVHNPRALLDLIKKRGG